MNFDNLAILDVETTGASAPYDRIIEIGVIRIEKNKIVKKFETLINPEVTISPFIENLTGIVGRQLKDAPLFSEIKSDLAELLDGCVFVAHNARFDYSFIRNEYKRIGVPYSAKQLCTVKLSRLLFPNFSHHNLDSIIERFEIKCERRHRALDDAMVLWDFLQKVGNTTAPEKLQKAFDAILKKPSLPPLLKSKDVEVLPEKAGVYLFFGKSEIPLYIGKSINIKDRVLSHFINDVDSSTELEISQQIERIETIETGGELSALLLESEIADELTCFSPRTFLNSKRFCNVRRLHVRMRQTYPGHFDMTRLELIPLFLRYSTSWRRRGVIFM
jgi:DNA polymerase-3 subunit epsilon